MKQNTLAIALLCLTVGCADRSSLPAKQTEAQDSGTAGIEERLLVPAGAGKTAQLYLVLTAKGNARTWHDLVVRNAQEALDSLDEYGDGGPDAIVVFFIRPTEDSSTGFVSGFGRAQLKELTELPEDKARMKASEHAWALQNRPEKRQNN